MLFQIAEPQDITVIAALEPVAAGDSAASVTLSDEERIRRLGAPLIAELVRLAPSAAVSTSGPAGSLTEVRQRGAEADHTLLFIDGIRANDPAAGNAPRFELVNADLASRLEVVRGPQSALWGSEAIGGVVAVRGALGGGSAAEVEAGSLGTLRGAARAGFGTADNGLAIGIAGQRSNGVDSFDGHGDRDGYSNRSLRVAGRAEIAPGLALEGAAFQTRGTSEYDGYVGWARGDTLDETRNRLAAGRVGLSYAAAKGIELRAGGSLLGSRNAYYLDDSFLTAATGERRTLSFQAAAPIGQQRLVIAAETEREDFAAEIAARRRHRALTLQWRGKLGPVRTDVAFRRDAFSEFKDATSLRASALIPLVTRLQAALTYGEGIAQPTFYDLYGYPGFSVGNPALRPERSRGAEASLRFARRGFSAAATVWRQRLTDEIVPDYSSFPGTTANAEGISRRKGFEIEAGYAPSPAIRLSATYALVDADEPYLAGRRAELRRPRHSGHVALDGARGKLSYGVMAARTGARDDFDFDAFLPVRLKGYWLVGGRAAYALDERIELTARLANALDTVHEDVVGYRSEGRSVHGGIRLRLDR